MSAFSNYLEDQITGWINGSAFASTLTGGTWVQLYTADPTDAGLHTGAYLARVNVAANGWTRGTGGAGTLTNTSTITVTTNAASAATVTHVAVFDVVTAGAGNMLFYGQLATSKTVAAGDEIKFNASGLTLTVA